MSNFTKEQINKYADDLLIGLSNEETDMIPNIKDVEIQSYPFDMEVTDLRSDDKEGETIDIDELLRNCGRVEGREVEVPKVVG